MIEKMKFLSITGPKSDIDRVVNEYLSKYEIHLENALAELKSVQDLTPYIQINPYKEDLKLTENFKKLLPEDTNATDKKLSIEDSVNLVRDLDKNLNAINQERAEYEAQRSRYQELYEKIEPFMGLEYDISTILQFKHLKFRFGKIPKEYYNKLKSYIYNDMESVFYRCHSDDQYVWGIYFCVREHVSRVDAAFASMHFERLFLPDAYEGTPMEAHTKLADELKGTNQKIAACDKKIQDQISDRSEDILAAYNRLSAQSENFDVRKLAACTNSKHETFYILCGWMTEKESSAFQKEIADDPNLFCFLEDDNSTLLVQPPTKLKNPKIFKPFEMFVKMYGLPGYNEMDPTIFVALTYSFIFGCMFGDVGQGLCLVVGGALLYKFKNITLAAIMSLAGIFSTIFGVFYGSFFGFENVIPALWLKPKTAMTTLPFIGTMNTVFVVAIAFGMFLILFTMILHIINAVRTHDVEGTYFDQNSISGLVFYGALTTVVFLYMSGHTLPATAILVVMFVIPLILIMLKEPLTRLVKGRNPAIEGGKGMYFMQSFFELFEVLLSYLSNTLSFVRMGAFAVSHAAMMEVVLMLAGAESGGSPNWIVIVFGNVFVCAMEGLIVGIQVLRLEYYEMFSRFYTGNGREFKPFLKKN
ncbi:ATPase [Blautia liquoris]|uniref:ATPase n=1 Tax=Blautia liquoris TaxID=2779518 RepID=A0A7M2RH77_9FIRM|nr:V-type ATPase 116kDa subunit family protein [Blautia liquoris]QOV19478.1 ATPase [Blautia liquoris]